MRVSRIRGAGRLQAANATLAEVFDGPPEFTDLSVMEEWAV